MMDILIFAAYRMRFISLLYLHFVEQPLLKLVPVVKRWVWR